MNAPKIRSTRRSLGRALVLLLGAGSALGLAHVDSASAADVPQMKVSYADLDLSRPEDVRVLYRRLRYAASEVCQPAPLVELSAHAAWEQCYRAALERAVVQVNAPQLLALHRAQLGAAGRG